MILPNIDRLATRHWTFRDSAPRSMDACGLRSEVAIQALGVRSENVHISPGEPL
jgi:hypothetical protein